MQQSWVKLYVQISNNQLKGTAIDPKQAFFLKKKKQQMLKLKETHILNLKLWAATG